MYRVQRLAVALTNDTQKAGRTLGGFWELLE